MPRSTWSWRAVPGDDAGALLPAVLQGVEPEVGQVGRVVAAVDAEDAAHGCPSSKVGDPGCQSRVPITIRGILGQSTARAPAAGPSTRPRGGPRRTRAASRRRPAPPGPRRRPRRSRAAGTPASSAARSTALDAPRARRRRSPAPGSRRRAPPRRAAPRAARPGRGRSRPRRGRSARPPSERSCAVRTGARDDEPAQQLGRAAARRPGPPPAAAPARCRGAAAGRRSRRTRRGPRRAGRRGPRRAAKQDAGRLAEVGDHADHAPTVGVGIDRLPLGLVVEGDVARDDRHAERPAGLGHAADRLAELPGDLGVLGVAEVEAVGQARPARRRRRRGCAPPRPPPGRRRAAGRASSRPG